MLKHKGKVTPTSPYRVIPNIAETVWGAGLKFHHEGIGLSANLTATKTSCYFNASGNPVMDPTTIVNLSVEKRLVTLGDYGELYANLLVNNFSNELTGIMAIASPVAPSTLAWAIAIKAPPR